jgi:uncharacterized repeat protein (TIGR03803 family)
MQKKMVFLAMICVFVITFVLSRAAEAQGEKVLYSFTGGSDGGQPSGGVVVDAKGNLYGTTGSGGAASEGSVFEVAPNANGTWTETVIHSFAFNGSDGAFPYSGVVFDAKGNLYGTTVAGGPTGQGAIYQLSPGANGTWTEQILYSFQGGSDAGSALWGNLAIDAAGNLYGTSYSGGTYRFGTVYELSPGSSGAWTEKVLYSFSGGNDGGYPLGVQLAIDGAGNLYGTVSSFGGHDYGLVFELVRGSNGTWAEKVLHAFQGGSDGTDPSGSLVFDSSGNLYGTTLFSVFELSPGSSGTWTEKQIHRFTGVPDGANAESGLIFDKAGNLYGTTYDGGAHRGTVFKLAPNVDGTWSETMLHKFSSSGGDGVFPAFPALAIDANGNLYGTTSAGGASNNGVVFGVKP